MNTMFADYLMKVENARTTQKSVNTLDELMSMEKYELVTRMRYHDDFFQKAIELTRPLMEEFIELCREDEPELSDCRTTEDVLNSGYFGKTPEAARCEFARTLFDVCFE